MLNELFTVIVEILARLTAGVDLVVRLVLELLGQLGLT